MSLVTLKNVSKTFPNGVQALQPTELSFEQGQFIVVLGPSGAGKSTLLRTINGLETPSEGKVVVDGVELNRRNLRKVRANVGMVFQQFNLVDRLNVMSNVLCGRLSHRHWLSSLLYLFPKTDYQLGHEALMRVGLVDKAWDRADRLSGGQQQRVGIARALAQRPKLILADEPVASLDPVTSHEVMGLLKNICEQDGITVIANLHQVELTKRYADRVVALNSGQVVFDGTPDQLSEPVLAKIYQGSRDESHEQHDLALAYG